MAEDLDLQWQNDYLKSKLQTGVVDVLFMKKNGEQRRMMCTLDPTRLPAQTDLEEQIQNRTRNPEVLAVWDLEKEDWRSFRYDSVIGFMADAAWDK